MKSEADLVGAASRGDRAAFGALLAPRLDRLYAVAHLALRDTDAAEDALQEALIRAWRDLGSLREPERLDGWLSRLVSRACIDEARRRRRWRMTPHVPWLSEGTAEPPSLDERERLERALGRLSPDHRLVLALRFHLDLGLAEIAEATGVPLGTVKSRLHHALNEMRAALAADERAALAALQETAR
jgi:RNA polymerase sigma-70 factor (ECF subfamily)